MKKEDIPVLNQIMKSIEDNLANLEQSYTQKNFENFSRTKNLVIQFQNKILKIVK